MLEGGPIEKARREGEEKRGERGEGERSDQRASACVCATRRDGVVVVADGGGGAGCSSPPRRRSATPTATRRATALPLTGSAPADGRRQRPAAAGRPHVPGRPDLAGRRGVRRRKPARVAGGRAGGGADEGRRAVRAGVAAVETCTPSISATLRSSTGSACRSPSQCGAVRRVWPSVGDGGSAIQVSAGVRDVVASAARTASPAHRLLCQVALHGEVMGKDHGTPALRPFVHILHRCVDEDGAEAGPSAPPEVKEA